MEKLVTELCALEGISGFEYRINREIEKLFLPYCDETKIDALGNVIAVKRCGKPNAKKLLIEAHIDEIGLIVKNIDENGFITFLNVGGIDPRILPAMEVVVHGSKDVKGVIGAKPPHIMADGEEKNALKIENIAIDTGLSAEEVKKLVSVGNSITFFVTPKELENGQITGKSLDDRASIAVLIEVMKRLQNAEVDVYAVAAVQEEVGGFGAMTAGFSVCPDFAIAIDVCHGITPDNSYCAYELGGGAVITVGPNIHPKMFELLKNTARKHNIKFQIDVDGGNTGTDAWQFQVIREGIPTGLLSIPLKYMHTLVETADIYDIIAVSELITAFISELSKEEEFRCF